MRLKWLPLRHHLAHRDSRVTLLDVLQDDISSLKHQLSVEQNAATAANELRAAAVQQLHLAEQHHQHQLQLLENELKQYKWRLWEYEAGRANVARHTEWSPALQDSSNWQAPAVWPGSDPYTQGKGQIQELHSAPCCTTAADRCCEPLAVSAATAGSSLCQGQLSVELVAIRGPELDMLPEVAKLFELHRNTMV